MNFQQYGTIILLINKFGINDASRSSATPYENNLVNGENWHVDFYHGIHRNKKQEQVDVSTSSEVDPEDKVSSSINYADDEYFDYFELNDIDDDNDSNISHGNRKFNQFFPYHQLFKGRHRLPNRKGEIINWYPSVPPFLRSTSSSTPEQMEARAIRSWLRRKPNDILLVVVQQENHDHDGAALANSSSRLWRGSANLNGADDEGGSRRVRVSDSPCTCNESVNIATSPSSLAPLKAPSRSAESHARSPKPPSASLGADINDLLDDVGGDGNKVEGGVNASPLMGQRPQNKTESSARTAALANPSPCLWAIATCCSPNNYHFRYGCFNFLSCTVAFWDSEVCQISTIVSATAEILAFYRQFQRDGDGGAGGHTSTTPPAPVTTTTTTATSTTIKSKNSDDDGNSENPTTTKASPSITAAPVTTTTTTTTTISTTTAPTTTASSQDN